MFVSEVNNTRFGSKHWFVYTFIFPYFFIFVHILRLYIVTFNKYTCPFISWAFLVLIYCKKKVFAASGGSGWGGWCLRHFTQSQNELHNIYQTVFVVFRNFFPLYVLLYVYQTSKNPPRNAQLQIVFVYLIKTDYVYHNMCTKTFQILKKKNVNKQQCFCLCV